MFIFDWEANGLLEEVTKVHCGLFKEFGKDNWILFLDFSHPQHQQAVKFVESKGVNVKILDFSGLAEWLTTEPLGLGCHNSFFYDFPMLKKMFGIQYDMFKDKECRGTINDKPVALFDTLSMSRCLYPDRPVPDGCPMKVKCPVTGKMKTVGGHGLEAWGYRVANKKVQIDDWRDQDLWTYVDRVWEDVLINEMVWVRLLQEASMRGEEEFMLADGDIPKGNKQINWKNALRRNMLADFLMAEQEFQGVVFRKDKAELLVERIDKMMLEIENFVEPQLPKKPVAKSKQPNFPAKPFTEGSGEISSNGWKWLIKLGYPVNMKAFDYVEPPKKAFKGDGSLSKTGEAFCSKFGITDVKDMPDFIRKKLSEPVPKPLPEDLLLRAKEDLNVGKMPDLLMEDMKLSNQDDIKRYLVREAGWIPTIWRLKDVTKDQFKKQRPDAEIDKLVCEYITKLPETEYFEYILKQLGITKTKWDSDSDGVFRLLRRKARGLPTSPQLKDARGVLCPNLERVEGGLAKQIVKWLSLRNRRSVLKPLDDEKETGLLNHPRLEKDGKLPARANGITNTNRRKHSICANMPKPKKSVLLGKEMRELWTVPEDCFMIGIDGSNLEGMIAAAGAYAFDNGYYLEIMESGDAHTRNASAYSEAAGREVTRDDGKGVTYGIMYGAQATKISVMLGISQDRAQAVIDAFWDNNPGLKGRKEWLENFWEATGKKYIPAMDGRKIWTRSKHSLLNAYQQSGGACLFDLVGILLHLKLVRTGLYDKGVRRVIYYHDEYQMQVPKEFVTLVPFNTEEEAKQHKIEGKQMAGKPKCINGVWYAVYSQVGELVVGCIEQAAKMMNLPVKITGDYLVGTPEEGWAGTH